MSGLGEPLASLLGPRTAQALAEGLDLHTVGDLLRHYPRRYERRGELTALHHLEIGDNATVLARVKSSTPRKLTGKGGKRSQMLTVEVGDERSSLSLVFFGRGVFRPEQDLRVGREALFAGKVSAFNGKRQLSHPMYLLLDGDHDVDATAEAAFVRAMIPVYPATEAITSWKIQKAVGTVIDITHGLAEDMVPPDIRDRQGLLPLPQALRWIHQPENHAQVEMATQRLRFDEVFPLQVVLAQRRAAIRALPATARPAVSGRLLDAFDARLPFTLTDGQLEVGSVLAEELARTQPMNRLLQGEVGSGKTIVALRAMLQVVDAGGQAALLAPTEVLAGQHYHSIVELLGPLGQAGMIGAAEHSTRVALLTGSQNLRERRRNSLDAASGAAGIVIGTHAVIQDSVTFSELGLVVVDEQHRFGVEQRDALRAKALTAPHVLVMTATPIPRTVAMTIFGDLEVSTLSELPRGRSPIATHVVPAVDKPHFLARTWERVREEAEAGHQTFVVCPRIGAEDAETGTAQGADGRAQSADARAPGAAVEDLVPILVSGPLHGLRLGVLHGRLPTEEKEEAMRRFASGEIDVLVATTMVEVGVDVPNATVMVVMDADRFGVSQLHQLRGRVGRGSAPSTCLLVTELRGGPARERLDAVAATNDGFELSQLDLMTRREGDVLGTSQSGSRSSLRLLSVLEHPHVIAAAREEASALVAADLLLAEAPAELRRVVVSLHDDERSGYLDKA